MIGYIAALWGLVGICLLLGGAIYRLGGIALQTLDLSLSWYHWLALAFSIVFMGFAEGYRGFQKAFSPRVAARIHYLSRNVTPVRLLLAPAFCMGYFHIQRRRQIVTICLTLGIIALVQLVHMLAQPWRGIVDAGVVVGLAWGLVSLLIFTLQAFFSSGFKHSPETP